jgi:adenine-specific DNA methylase
MTTILLKNFKLSKEGKFSITKPCESEQITRYMSKFIDECEEDSVCGTKLENCTITDATACVGGDLINFSRKLKKVNGVEISNENFEVLEENCKIFCCKNVKLYNEDYLKMYSRLTQDIIYIDPKWGGPDYKALENIKLYVGAMDLGELINRITKKKLAKFIFVKVPLNAYLVGIDYGIAYTVYNRSKNPSFRLICLKV